MNRQHTTNDCDETCTGCVRCYQRTGQTICDKTCAHARATFAFPLIATCPRCQHDSQPLTALGAVTCWNCGATATVTAADVAAAYDAMDGNPLVYALRKTAPAGETCPRCGDTAALVLTTSGARICRACATCGGCGTIDGNCTCEG